jgi:GNAT superfamily N-acetyltransferase
MNTLLEQLDGPRLIEREELIDSLHLFRLCFGGPEIENEEEILANHVPPRRGGIYALLHEGKPVSQIVTFHDSLKVYDGVIRAGSIGGVCTHPNYRGQGLASHLLKHCTQQLTKEGARLMLISGDGGVYTHAGNVLQGKYMYFLIKPEQPSRWRSTPDDLVLRRVTSADALFCSQLYQAESIHFIRRPSDWSAMLQNPMSNTYIHADPWIVERMGRAVAYLFLGIPYGLSESAGVRYVSEYTGSRVALVDAIPVLMTANHLQNLTWPVAWQDAELIQLLQDSGYLGNITNLDGHTLRIINFPSLMNDLRPILRARLDAKLLRGLRFEQSGPLLGGTGTDRYTITRGPDRLELDGAGMTLLAMGNADPLAEAVHAPGALAEVISALFPLPSFLPGLNYH